MTTEQYINHRNYFLTLEKDLGETTKYVEHCYDNYKTYSFEFFKIIQLSCAEIDSLLKDLCKCWNPDTKASNITQYANIIIPEYSKIEDYSTVMNFSSPPLSFLPWKDWSPEKAPTWWRQYQSLKHNHTENFKYATLENAYLCLSALFIILHMLRNTFKVGELHFLPCTQRMSIGYILKVTPPSV